MRSLDGSFSWLVTRLNVPRSIPGLPRCLVPFSAAHAHATVTGAWRYRSRYERTLATGFAILSRANKRLCNYLVGMPRIGETVTILITIFTQRRDLISLRQHGVTIGTTHG